MTTAILFITMGIYFVCFGILIRLGNIENILKRIAEKVGEQDK